jgi:dTMP kinase
MVNYNGKFIVFEGGEGTGKTTQIALLEKRLMEQGFDVYLTREPGGSGCVIGEKIRTLLKDPQHREMVPEAELFLFLASRAQHVKQLILPKLQQGTIVICDRFFGSTLAYQHFGRGLFNLDEVKRINNFATQGLEPDLTALLDIEPEKGIGRKQDTIENDRLDSEALEFHHKVRNGYLTLAQIRPNWSIIPADDTVENIHEQLWHNIGQLLDTN